MTSERDELVQELETLGESEVRVRHARRAYQSWKGAVVEEWLRNQEESRKNASNREQMRIARSAKNAAWTAAIAAIIAAISAVISIAFSD